MSPCHVNVVFSAVSNKEADVTIVFCPGLASTVEHTYVKSFVSLATQSGYRVVVLNHLGMLTGKTITTPRVFNLGKLMHTLQEKNFHWNLKLAILLITNSQNLNSAHH